MSNQTSRSSVTRLTVLSPEDHQRFFELHVVLSATETRFNRNRKRKTLQEQLWAIHSFSARDGPDDWKRLFVCEVALLDASTITINSPAVATVVGKSKSSVNGTLQKMQWTAGERSAADRARLTELISCLAQRPDELRHWTIRKWTSGDDSARSENVGRPRAADTQQSDADDWEP
jgi:predicted HNH restriction endonuclease